MVLADSHGLSRIPCYSGTLPGDRLAFAYGALTLCGAPFQSASTSDRFCNSSERLSPLPARPTTPSQHRRQAVPLRRFRLFPFRSPLLRESRLLSLPRGTEMFQFPRFPRPALCVQTGVTGHDPCRVSPFGHPRISLVGSSPWLFAATHVLLRHLAPRHPPLALCSLGVFQCSCSLCSSQGAAEITSRA